MARRPFSLRVGFRLEPTDWDTLRDFEGQVPPRAMLLQDKYVLKRSSGRVRLGRCLQARLP
jgi:hypothetical protein